MNTSSSLKTITTFLLVFLFLVMSQAQTDPEIRWMSLDEAYQKSKIEKKKIFVDLYTDWCKWCEKMEKVTFQDKKVIRYLNENFYAVKLNGEEKESITFKGKKYKFTRQYGKRGHHQLAELLTGGEIGYPTIIFLDEDFKTIQAIQGFQEPKMFFAFLSYIGQNHQKEMPWSQFYHKFQETSNNPE